MSAEVDENLLPSGETAQERTAPLWQAKSFSVFPVVIFQTYGTELACFSSIILFKKKKSFKTCILQINKGNRTHLCGTNKANVLPKYNIKNNK